MKLNLNLHLDPKNAKSTKFSYLYNQLIQAWSMLCFVAAAAGGVYLLLHTEHIILGPVLILLGLGGAYFCCKQLKLIVSEEEKEKEKQQASEK